MRAAALPGDNLGPSEPQQRWPTARMCRAAARQKAIRAALTQLAPNLQAVIECAYEAQGQSAQTRHEHDLMAPLVARVARRMQYLPPVERKGLARALQYMERLLEAAHEAFRIAHGRPREQSRRHRVRATASRWLAEDACA